MAETRTTEPRSSRPRGLSLRAIVGGGFTIVAVCLGLALSLTISRLELLGRQSEQLLTSGMQTTRLIEQLAERIADVERTARQYMIVGSDDLLRVYNDRRTTLLQTMGALQAGEQAPTLAPSLTELQVLLARIQRSVEQRDRNVQLPEGFAAMNEIAQRARSVAAARYYSEVSSLQRRVDQLRTALVALTVAIVTAALLAAVAFSRLISRPMRQITSSIDALGRAELDAPVEVSGPRDLQAIGASLDWLRQRIHDLEAQKSTFVRHMSHELKSPLANIRAGIELLQESSPDDVDTREIAEIVERNATRLQRQIDDLLAYAGWQDAQPPQQPVTVRLHELVEKSVADQRFDATTRDVSLRQNLEPLTITAAEGQIRAIVDNLVSNAIKYSPPGGTVDVRLRKLGDIAHIEVTDEGPGIPRELRQKVFEPFFRGPGASASAGTGIGLALAAAAARAHGGSINVLDTHSGACLAVDLPLRPPAVA